MLYCSTHEQNYIRVGLFRGLLFLLVEQISGKIVGLTIKV